MSKRVVQVIRVSEQGDRDDEDFMSPEDQQRKGEQRAELNGWKYLEPLREIDVSGKRPLEKRKGLKRAVEMVESGEADIVLVAYFDRLVRSLEVQQEVKRRVEAAGGDVITDIGKLTNTNANGTFINNIFGASAQHYVDLIAEKSWEGIMLAIEKGHWPVALIPGLRKTDEGEVELDPDTWEAMRDAYEMRASGATIAQVRGHLAANGIKRSHAGTNLLLKSRQALGELHYDGKLIATVPAIVEDPDVWRRIEDRIELRGRKAKSDRLLARLGVLRCGTCGARMSIGSQNQRAKTYWFYRCSDTSDCPQRMAIGADIAERVVVRETKRLSAAVMESISGELGMVELEAELERTQKTLDGLILAFEGLDSEPAAIKRIRAAREERDEAKQRYDDAVETLDGRAFVISTAGSWDDLSLSGKRRLIKTVIRAAKVWPGRGEDRITIEENRLQAA